MNESAFRYRIYKVLLESDLTQNQKDALMEGGWIDNLKAWAGAVKDTGNLDISKVFSDNKFKRRVKVAGDNITKEIKDLVDIASNAGVEKKVVLSMIGAILSGSGITPENLSKAEQSTSAPSRSTSPGGSLTPGRAPEVDLGSASNQPAASTTAGALVAGMLGSASGTDPQKAVEQAKEKDIPFQKAYKNLINKVAEESEEDTETVKKVLDWLLDNEKIIPNTKITFGESTNMRSDNVLYERWSLLSGIKLISEEGTRSRKGKSRTAAKASSTSGPETSSTTEAPTATASPSATGTETPAASAATSATPAAKDETPPSGEYVKLASLVSKQVKISTKVVTPILDTLVKKCGVKLAK